MIKKILLNIHEILKKDISNLKKLKVDYLFLPNKKEIYKKGVKKKIKILIKIKFYVQNIEKDILKVF